MSGIYSRIIGTGSYLPAKVLTNADLAGTVDTSDEWILQRTGIRERHIAADNEKASDLALQASRRALEMAGIAADQLDLIIVATTTPDMVFPSTACILQSKLGVKNMPAFDVQAVCSGFVYALNTADLYIKSGQYEHILVVGAKSIRESSTGRIVAPACCSVMAPARWFSNAATPRAYWLRGCMRMAVMPTFFQCRVRFAAAR